MTGIRLTGSPQFPNADVGDYYMLQTNNIMQVTSHQTSVWKANESAYPYIELSGNTILHIGDFAQSLIYGQGEDLATAPTNCSFTVPATITLWADGSFTHSKSYIREITVAPFTAILNADIC